MSPETVVSGAIALVIYLFIFWNKYFHRKNKCGKTDIVVRLKRKSTADKQSQTEKPTSHGLDFRKAYRSTEDKCLQTEYPTENNVIFPNEVSSKNTEDKCLQTEYPTENKVIFPNEVARKVNLQTFVSEDDDVTDKLLQNTKSDVFESYRFSEEKQPSPETPSTEDDNITDEYPPPTPPHITKSDVFQSREFSEVKQHTLEVTKTDHDSFESLLEDLCGNYKSALQRVYAIYCWITNRKCPDLDGTEKNLTNDSPLKYLYLILQGKGTFAEMMCKMCRQSNIPCVIIHGFEKSEVYETRESMTKEKHETLWNAVYLENNWWFVNCNWASERAYIYRKGDSCPEFHIEDDKGFGNRSSPLSIHLHNLYFLTDPSIFIRNFYPFDDHWQLLREKVSIQEFESGPFLHPAFHFLKLEFVNKDIGFLVTVSETFTLRIKIPPKSVGKLSFDYKIFRLHSYEKEHECLNMKDYSLHYFIDDVAYFDLRFPSTAVGEYKLQIYCNNPSDNTSSYPVCEFKLLCEKGMHSIVPMQVDPGVGWGNTSTELEKHGVKVLSHVNGFYPWIEDEMKFDFIYPEKSYAKAELIKSSDYEKDFEKYVTIEKKGTNVQIFVHTPHREQGEFVLKIFIRDSEALEFVNIFNYLLDRTETQDQRRKRERLLKLLVSDDAKQTEVQEANEKFQRSGGKDLGEVARAERKIHHLSLREALTEYQSYRTPPKTVTSLVHSTYFLLFQDRKDVLEWKNMRKLLKKVTLNDFNVKHIPMDSLDRATNALKKFDMDNKLNMHENKLDRIKNVSSAASARLYEWARDVIRSMKEDINE